MQPEFENIFSILRERLIADVIECHPDKFPQALPDIWPAAGTR